MFALDYAGLTTARYLGAALPDAAETALAWRIVRLTFAGDVLSATEWADGDDNLDNRWDLRATLTYVANSKLSFVMFGILDIVPAGTRPGTAFTCGADVGALKHEVSLFGIAQRRLSSGSPGANEYLLAAGATGPLTMGNTIAAAHQPIVRVFL